MKLAVATIEPLEVSQTMPVRVVSVREGQEFKGFEEELPTPNHAEGDEKSKQTRRRVDFSLD